MGCLKKRTCTRALAVLSALAAITGLFGSFREAVEISENHPDLERPSVYWGGNSSVFLRNGILHTTYSRTAPGTAPELRHELVYTQYNPEAGETVSFVLDEYPMPYPVIERGTVRGTIEPVIGHLADNRIFILNNKLFPREEEHIYRPPAAYKVSFRIPTQSGDSLTIEPFFDYRGTRGQILTENEKLHLLFNPEPGNTVYHKFFDTDHPFDGDFPLRLWWEDDVIYGDVHSNSDIYLRHNSWPTFHGKVTTAGQVRVIPGGGTDFPEEQIFLGGLTENHSEIPYSSAAGAVRRNGSFPMGPNEVDDEIAHVTIEGTSYTILRGEIEINEPSAEDEWIEGVNQFTVYDSYPPYGPVGDTMAVNRIAMPDTIWRDGPRGSVAGSSAFIPVEMWISGEVEGRQTWASSHDIYLKGDLTYSNTEPGLRPDGYDEQGNQTFPVNPTDFLGIISEKSIKVQYGHWDPINSVRVRPNTDNIYLYGAYSALGESENFWDDGVFTIQYKYPKGSTPPQMYQGERYTNIDLHLFKYPATEDNPWPPGLDYPYYNPLWPEPGQIWNVPGLPAQTPNPHNAPEIVRERGEIYLFGSVSQRRSGAIDVSSEEAVAGEWNIDGEINPDIPPSYGTVPPGRTGYNKRYKPDLRFEEVTPPSMDGIGNIQTNDLLYKYMTSADGEDFETVLSGVSDESLTMASHNNSVAILNGSIVYLFRDNDDEYERYEIDIPEDEKVEKLLLRDNLLYLLTTSSQYYPPFYYNSKVYRYSLTTDSLTLLADELLTFNMQTLHDFNGSILWAYALDEEIIEIQIVNRNGSLEPYRWEHNIPSPGTSHFVRGNSKLSLLSDKDILHIIVHFKICPLDGSGPVYASWGRFVYGPAVAENPHPADEAVDIPVELEKLSWEYQVDEDYVDPVGFRVYFNDTGDFDKDNSYVWLDYDEQQTKYSTADILPDILEYDKDYYWKVVPTAIPPEQRGEPDSSGKTGISTPQKAKQSENLSVRGDAIDVPVWCFRTEIDTSVDDELPQQVTELHSSYPNPFNPNTIIHYTIGEKTNVELSVYNSRGQLVKKLVDDIQSPGSYRAEWNGIDHQGSKVPSGLYFYRLKTADYDKTGKMMLVK